MRKMVMIIILQNIFIFLSFFKRNPNETITIAPMSMALKQMLCSMLIIFIMRLKCISLIHHTSYIINSAFGLFIIIFNIFIISLKINILQNFFFWNENMFLECALCIRIIFIDFLSSCQYGND